MQPGEYIKAVLQTESLDYPAIEGRIAQQIRLLHALIGINTENGELQDQLKKYFFYSKPLDLVNLKEELGDLLWYVALAMDDLGFTFEDVWERNIAKLKARYGNRFNQEGALARDYKREREAMQDQIPHCPELNAPGEVGCICLACVLERQGRTLENLEP